MTEHQVYAIILGHVLTAMRGERSQVTVSKATAISQSSLSRFEQGQTVPDVYQLRQLALHYDIEVGHLVGLVDAAIRRVRSAAKRGRIALAKAKPEIVRALAMLATAKP
jgi:transcriptional regulator with XRE-family HTH domain